MAAEFQVNLNGADELDDGLLRLVAKLRDLRTTWPLVATVFHKSMRQQFSSQGAYGSGSWAPLSPAYGAWKERKHPGLPIMELSGRLGDSLMDAFGNADSTYEATEDTLRIGTKTPYARFHQYGTGRMPARPLIALTEADKAEIVKIVRDSFANEATELGFRVVTR